MAVNASIGGSVSGQVTIGNHNVQLRADGGTVVYVAVEPAKQAVPRTRPVALRPRRPARFVDRADAVATVEAALAKPPALVEISGVAGIGKTALLRTLAYDPCAARFAAGLLYLPQADAPSDDLLFEIADAFFTFDGGYVPTRVQLRHLLTGLDALLLLDDLGGTPDDVAALFDSVPDTSIVYGTAVPRELDVTTSVVLRELAAEDATSLAVAAGADPAVTAGVPGVPAQVLRVAAGVPEPGAAIASLAPGERAVMSLLAQVPTQRLPASAVARAAANPNANETLAKLAHLRLVEADGDTVRLTADVATRPEVRALGDGAAGTTALLEALIGSGGGAADVRRRGAPVEHLLAKTLALGAPDAALQAAQRFSSALPQAGALGRWERVLGLGAQAARALGDGAAEGWALHELGTRALLLDDRTAAETLLNQALALRTAAGDRAGKRATQHNLDVLHGVVPPGIGPSSGRRMLRPKVVAIAAALAATATGTAAALLPTPVHTWVFGAAAAPAPSAETARGPTPQSTYVSMSPPRAPPARTPSASTPRPAVVPSPHPTVTQFSVIAGAGTPAPPRATSTPTPPPRVTPTPQPTFTPTPPPTFTPTPPPTFTPTPKPVRLALPAVVDFRSTAPTVSAGTITSLCYEVTGASRITISGFGTVRTQRGCVRVQPTAPVNRYMLVASNAAGRAPAAYAEIAVRPTWPPPPHLPSVVRFGATRAIIESGTSTTLCYTVYAAERVTIEGIGNVPPSTGCITVTPMSALTRYVLVASNADGRAPAAYAEIAVLPTSTPPLPPPKVVRFAATRAVIEPGTSTTLCYTVYAADRVTIEGIGNVKPSTGCVTVKPTSPLTRYVLVASNAGLEASPVYANVYVRPTAPPHTETTSTATPLQSISVYATRCPGGPTGVQYALVGTATSLTVQPAQSKGETPAPGPQNVTTIKSPPSTGCVAVASGKYLVTATDGKNNVTGFVFVPWPPK